MKFPFYGRVSLENELKNIHVNFIVGSFHFAHDTKSGGNC